MLKFLLDYVLTIKMVGVELTHILKTAPISLSSVDLGTALSLHGCACATIALVLPKFLPDQYCTSRTGTPLFFFIIAFFIPVLGILGLVLAVVPGLRYIKNDYQLPIQVNKIRSLYDVQPCEEATSGKSNIETIGNMLLSQRPEKRMDAVYATLKLDDKNAIPLLRMALRDPVDDIRLLAYALIDRKEQRISERIELSKQRLENNEDSNTRHLYKQIASDYWELAHLGLVEGETLNFVLSKEKAYLETGLKLYPTDRGMHLQYAKLLLRLGNTHTAYDAFKTAENLGIAREKLLLYYAEIGFLNRRFAEVKQCMNDVNLPSARPEIQASARFWQEHHSVGS